MMTGDDEYQNVCTACGHERPECVCDDIDWLRLGLIMLVGCTLLTLGAWLMAKGYVGASTVALVMACAAWLLAHG